MKPLKLTEDQKDQLLEMCKVLFPEYSFSWEYEMYGRALKQEFNDVLAIYPDKGWGTNIHWFEFCMLHLAPKIIYPLYVPEKANSEEGYQIGIEEFGNDVLYYPKTHPVDYLYDKFLKLK